MSKRIGVFGTGMVGRVISEKLRSLGYEVVMGTRSVAQTMDKEEPDGYGNPPFKVWSSDHTDIPLLTFAEVAATCEIIFNCTNGQATIAVLKSAGDLTGKVLIDLANPLDFSQGMPPSLNPVNTDSLGEQIQRTFPELKVIKTLNSMNAGIMVDPGSIKGAHDVFICGDDKVAKQTVHSLLEEFGWSKDRIIDLGDISNARGTEMLLPIWLRLWNALGTAAFNFHIQRG